MKCWLLKFQTIFDIFQNINTIIVSVGCMYLIISSILLVLSHITDTLFMLSYKNLLHQKHPCRVNSSIAENVHLENVWWLLQSLFDFYMTWCYELRLEPYQPSFYCTQRKPKAIKIKIQPSISLIVDSLSLHTAIPVVYWEECVKIYCSFFHFVNQNILHYGIFGNCNKISGLLFDGKLRHDTFASFKV